MEENTQCETRLQLNSHILLRSSSAVLPQQSLLSKAFTEVIQTPVCHRSPIWMCRKKEAAALQPPALLNFSTRESGDDSNPSQ